MKIARVIKLAIIAVGCLGTAYGQNGYLRFTMPSEVCAGSSLRLSFGYDTAFNVVFDLPMASQSHAEQAFLPDGVPCAPYGCSYRSSLTFSGFVPGTTISSMQDIKYVRVNMEHSWIGDLYIGVVCPNGQRAALMNWKGTGSSSCDDQVPAGSRSWASGSNVSGGTYLGGAYDHDNSSYPCNPSASYNQPGTGWNYCWSSNTSSGYQYASGDGRIYRSGNRTGNSIDSSNVAAKRQFYKPEQNFSSLMGCPLNGTWYIEVIDAYSGDNGYVFDWELSLNPQLLPTQCALVSREVISPFVHRVNDSTYTFTPPSNLTADTTVDVTFRIVSSCGDTIDSTASVVVHPKYNINEWDTACDGYTLFGHTYTNDIMVVKHFATVDNCDSVMRYRLHILHSNSDSMSDTLLENDLPYIVDGDVIVPALQSPPPYPSGGTMTVDTTVVRTNAAGCDSVVNMTLTVFLNTADTADSTICRHELPLTWNGATFNDGGEQTVTLTGSHGIDSVLTMMLTVKEDSRHEIADTVVENSLPWGLAGHEVFVGDTVVEYLTQNAVGCDSMTAYSLHVWRNSLDSIDSTVCRHQLPLTWNGVPFTDSGVQTLPLTDMHGADSVTVMTLTVREDTQGSASDTVVENDLPWAGVAGMEPLTGITDTVYRLQNAEGCDSMLSYSLHVWWNSSVSVDSTVCRHELPIAWNGERFTDGGTRTATLVDLHGADSLVVMTVNVREDTYATIYDTVVESRLPHSYASLGLFDTITDTLFVMQNAIGCDSTVHYNLHVWYDVEVSYDTTVCENAFPLVWRDYSFLGRGPAVRYLNTVHGADSTVKLFVAVNPVYDTTLVADVCEDDGYLFNGELLRSNKLYRFPLTTVDGCDSVVKVDLTVWPMTTEADYDTVCLTQLPYRWEGLTLSYDKRPTIAATVTLTDEHGCDSVRNLLLNIKGEYLLARAHVTPTVVTLENLDVEFYDNSRDATERLWLIGDYETSLQSFRYTYPTEYDSLTATLIAGNTEGCHDTATVLLQIDRSAVTAPNAFTPNQDINNRWFVATMDIEEIDVWIYNRQGNLVCKYSGTDGYWDGRSLTGQECPQGSYVYKMQYRTRVHADRLQEKTGTLLLIR